MTDVNALKEAIARTGYKQNYIEKEVGVSHDKWHRIKQGQMIKVDEMLAICRVLKLSTKERDKIFFNQE